MKSRVACLFACILFSLLAQQKHVLEFDAASIKTNKDNLPGNSSRNARGHVNFHNYPLSAIIVHAYGIGTQRLAGAPIWTRAEHFDIDAVVEEDPAIGPEEARARNRLRLQALLETRFQLRVHRETKPLPSYVLVLAKDGPKLKVSAPDTPSSMRLSKGRSHLECRAQEIDVLAGFLWSEMDRLVFDETGLKDEYDFDLDFEPERREPSSETSNAGNRPSILTALQDQLGLRLESRKMPVELLMIDHVERPSVN
jgi:uncharacterized protein (TIGR03435 family)